MNADQAWKNDIVADLLLGCLLVCLAVASRLAFDSIPNFAAVGAVALFAGFCFSRSWRAGLVVALALVISDALFGFYELPVMLTVYGAMAVAVMIGRFLRNRERRHGMGWTRAFWVAGASLVVSLQFFLLTNAGVVLAGWYPLSADGFMASYVAGLPFFRYTVLGDLLFAQSLFGLLALAQHLASARLAGRTAAVHLRISDQSTSR